MWQNAKGTTPNTFLQREPPAPMGPPFPPPSFASASLPVSFFGTAHPQRLPVSNIDSGMYLPIYRNSQLPFSCLHHHKASPVFPPPLCNHMEVERSFEKQNALKFCIAGGVHLRTGSTVELLTLAYLYKRLTGNWRKCICGLLPVEEVWPYKNVKNCSTK